jgi:hypothetical protein
MSAIAQIGPRVARASGLVLLTCFYADPDRRRRAELVECLARNLANDAIDEVHVLVEDGVRPELEGDAKLRLVALGRRATYADLFEYANEQLAGHRVAIANADIYFDRGIARVGAIDLRDILLCLSRWNVGRDGSARLFEHGESQDAWIFDAPIRPFPSDFVLGVPGCDNRLAWEAEAAGLAVDNPARSVRAYHLHLSGVRRYSERERLHGSVRSVPAGFLGPARTVSVASAAFAEEMGYAVRTLDPGVSSHTNEERPFTHVPPPLRGLAFTQVVAGHAAPVEIDLLARGKLYVLAGDDWDGFDVARAWLAEHGFHERLPRVETAAGTGFEAWSLVGDAGERFVAPTQVALAGGRLVRRGT